MSEQGGPVTAAERIEEVCAEIKRLLATIEAQARRLQEEGDDDE
jgi:hypothetical protein